MINTQEKAMPNGNYLNHPNSIFLIDVDDFTVLEEKKDLEFFKIEDNKTRQIFHMKQIPNSDYDFFTISLKAIEMISEINHPCIEKLIGFVPISQNYNSDIAIICDLGFQSLSSVLHQDKKSSLIHELNDTKKLINAFGIAYGMDYLHSNNIIHRDLAPFNIFVDDHYKCPKICDLINSIKLPNTKPDFYGKLSYLAPEVLNEEKYTKSIDVYSYGIILYEIFTGEVPFKNMKFYKITKSIINGERPGFPTPIPKCQRDLIESCWSQDPNKRPTFSEICSELKNNKDFRKNTDENEFMDYIKFIEETPKTPNHPVELNPDILIDIKNYEKVDEIGEGSYSKVLLVKEKSTGKYLAAKSYKTVRFMRELCFYMLNEVKSLIDTKHPAVINIVGYSFINVNQKPNPTILLELAKCSLNDILRNNNDSSTSFKDWNNTKKLINAYGIAAGMRQLHSNNILHRDLKPNNILEDEFFFPKICDFELSKKVPNNDLYALTPGIGTPIYMAPELFNEEKYSKSVDVYAYGIILYEIFIGEVPYRKKICSIFPIWFVKENALYFLILFQNVNKHLLSHAGHKILINDQLFQRFVLF